jgi:hypothetical protein
VSERPSTEKEIKKGRQEWRKESDLLRRDCFGTVSAPMKMTNGFNVCMKSVKREDYVLCDEEWLLLPGDSV